MYSGLNSEGQKQLQVAVICGAHGTCKLTSVFCSLARCEHRGAGVPEARRSGHRADAGAALRLHSQTSGKLILPVRRHVWR